MQAKLYNYNSVITDHFPVSLKITYHQEMLPQKNKKQNRNLL